MGLFSSKKKTKVFTSVQRVMEDNMLPESGKTAVIKYILQDGSSMSNYLLNGLLESIALRAERMYEYAEKGKYAYGVPTAQLVTENQGRGAAVQLLDDLEGAPVSLDYYHFGPLNSIHVGWQTLVDQYGYQADSNEITSLSAGKGHKVYLEDMQAIYTQQSFDEAEPGLFEVWGNAPSSGHTPLNEGIGFLGLARYVPASPYIKDPQATQDSVRVFWVYLPEPVPVKEDEPLPPPPEPVRGYFDIPVIDTHPDEDGDYHHARYRVNGQVKYWTYRHGSGGHPSLDTLFLTDYQELGNYFPWIYYRHDKQNRVTSNLHSTHEYLSSKKLAKYLGMDYQQVGEAIHENPDIGDIEQAMMIMAVPANSQDQYDLKYLYEYFNVLYYAEDAAGPTLSLSSFLTTDGFTSREGRAIVIKDKEFQMTVRFTGMSRKRIAGSIGVVGSYAGGFGEISIEEEYQDMDGSPGIRIVKYPYHYYRKQTSRSMYEEVRVFDLKTSYHIWRKYSTTAAGESDNLLIPLDRSIPKLFSLPDREVLYARSLHNLFNTRVTYKVKWYQSGWFKIFMIIVAIVLTIIAGPVGYASWAALIAAGATAIAMYVVTYIAFSFLMQYAFQLFAEAVGVEIALVVAVVAAAFGGYQALNKVGSLSLEAVKQATANIFVKIGTGLAKAAMSVHQQNQMIAYQNELQEFELFKDAAFSELEEISKLLDMKSLTDPFEFIGEVPLIIWGESPQDFYQRTVHSGNIGVETLNVIPNYVSHSLKLPEARDTLMNFA